MDSVKVPFFELPDEGGDVFRSEEMIGLKWILACVPGHDLDVLQLLESRHAKAMMMNAPLIVVSDMPHEDVVSLRSELGIRLKIVSDENGAVLSSLRTEGPSLIVLNREHGIVQTYRGIDVQTLDRALRKASRL